MTQPSSLSGKPISQQPFKWSLRPQSLPRQSTHPTLPDPSSSCLAPLCVGPLSSSPGHGGSSNQSSSWHSGSLTSGSARELAHLLPAPSATVRGVQRLVVPRLPCEFQPLLWVCAHLSTRNPSLSPILSARSIPRSSVFYLHCLITSSLGILFVLVRVFTGACSPHAPCQALASLTAARRSAVPSSPC